MTFRRVHPNAEYRSLRLLSTEDTWELGMSPYSHGMRLRMGHRGLPPRLMDFCMGRDPGLWPELLVAVLARLEPLDESMSPEEIDRCFPWAGTRPNLAEHLRVLLPSRSISSRLP